MSVASAEQMRILASGNVGIGTTSPNYGSLSGAGPVTTFYNSVGNQESDIELVGGAGIAGGSTVGRLLLYQQGFASTPSYIRGFRNVSNGDIGVAIGKGGTDILTALNNETTGTGYSVGIGTDTPVGVLDVRGGIASSGGHNGMPIYLYAQSGNSGNTNGGNIILMPGTAVGTGTPGYVGIGTTSPSQLLEVDGASQFDGTLTGIGAGPQIVLGVQSSVAGSLKLWAPDNVNSSLVRAITGDVLQIVGPNSGSVQIGPNGIGEAVTGTGVGVNTLSPQVKLDVAGSGAPDIAGTEDEFLITRPVQAGTSWPQVAAFQLGTYNNGTPSGPDTRLDINLKAAANATLTGDTNVMTLLSRGNVGVGTTSPQYLLHVGSASASGAVAGFQNSADLCTLTPAASNPTWSCSSDVRLKTDIVDTGDALAWFGNVHVRDFTMKATGERQTGVIAQELATAHPDMVRMGSNGFLTVDSPNPWMLVKAIQELKADNDNLRAANDNLRTANEVAQIKTLSARLDAFEAKVKQ